MTIDINKYNIKCQKNMSNFVTIYKVILLKRKYVIIFISIKNLKSIILKS